MLNRSASLAMSTYVVKALPGKLDIKRHSPGILYVLGGYLPYISSPEPGIFLKATSLKLPRSLSDANSCSMVVLTSIVS